MSHFSNFNVEQWFTKWGMRIIKLNIWRFCEILQLYMQTFFFPKLSIVLKEGFMKKKVKKSLLSINNLLQRKNVVQSSTHISDRDWKEILKNVNRFLKNAVKNSCFLLRWVLWWLVLCVNLTSLWYPMP